MKLSEYAKEKGICYRTAYRWYKARYLDAYQAPSGTIIVNKSQDTIIPTKAIIYARVSGGNQRDDLERQLQRLREFSAARGIVISKEISEIGSGVNDKRPKLLTILSDPTIHTIIVEHRDRLTRFGYNYIETMLKTRGGSIIETSLWKLSSLGDRGKSLTKQLRLY